MRESRTVTAVGPTDPSERQRRRSRIRLTTVHQTRRTGLALLVAGALVAACGGGDGDESAPITAAEAATTTTEQAPTTTLPAPTTSSAPTTEPPSIEGETCRQEGLGRDDRGITYICVEGRFEPYLDGTEFVGTHPDLIAKYEQLLADREARASGGSGSSNGSGVLLEPASSEGDVIEMTREDAAGAISEVALMIVTKVRAGESDFEALDEQLRAVTIQLQERYLPLQYQGSSSPVNDWRYAVVWMSEQGVTGSAHARNLLAPFNRIGIDGVPSAFVSGPHRVGDVTVPTEFVKPGTYETFDVDGCFWERLDSAGNTIDNNFINAAPRAEVTIRSSDFAFNSERCGTWVEIG